jgi:hypothetical protein
MATPILFLWGTPKFLRHEELSMKIIQTEQPYFPKTQEVDRALEKPFFYSPNFCSF